MVKFAAVISAILVFSAEAARVARVDVKEDNVAQWDFGGLRLGHDPMGPLVPAMVPPPNTTFEVQSRERLDFFESNEYRWAFVAIRQGMATIPINQWFATLQGGFFGNLFGARRTTITNNNGDPLMVIEMAKYIWNPTRLHWSFRIRHPVTEAILYTINKDWYGAGFLFLRDEWRIFRGRQRHQDQIYHIVGSYFGFGHRFYHEKPEWRRGAPPVAEATQSIGRSLVGLPDVFSLKVHEGEDTALLLAATVIIDMVHESEAAARARERARQRQAGNSLLQETNEEEENFNFQVGAAEDVWSEEAMARAENPLPL